MEFDEQPKAKRENFMLHGIGKEVESLSASVRLFVIHI